MRVHLKVKGPKKPSRGTIRKDADLLAGNLRWSYGDEGSNLQSNIGAIDINVVKSRMLQIRGQLVLVDRDVAALYGVETKALNQAVKRNVERFPQGYVFQLDDREFVNWKSQIVTSNLSKDDEASIKMGIRRAPYAFTEKGLYMLATVLKSDRAVRATLAIIETYAQVRAMVRDMEALQTPKDGSVEQASKLTQAGHKLASLIGDNLSTNSTKTTIELNLAVLKITHEVTRRIDRGERHGAFGGHSEPDGGADAVDDAAGGKEVCGGDVVRAEAEALPVGVGDGRQASK